MLQQDVEFKIRVEHDGLYTDSYKVEFELDGAVALSLDVPVAELSGGAFEKLVSLKSGNYLGSVTAIGQGGSTQSDKVPVPVLFPVPNKPIFILVG